MPTILSISEASPPYELKQEDVLEFARELFSSSFKDIERLLTVFHNGCIEKRYFVKPLDWYREDHSFQEKNKAYIEAAVQLGTQAIQNCLQNQSFLLREILCKEIDAIFFISSTGISTPSMEARIMNVLPFSEHTKRIPIWGLGCAGGAAGLSRAFEYCKAFPNSKVLVLCIELCSLTFQRNDFSKSNLIGSSLFADGAACSLIVGDEVNKDELYKLKCYPNIVTTQSTLMKHSLDVMGWDLRKEGLFVIFSRDIPSIIEKWLKPNVNQFLNNYHINIEDIHHFIAHPGGKKVLEAYKETLSLPSEMIDDSLHILRNYGNMSSVTVIYVLKRFLEKGKSNEMGLVTSLGPGFSSELLLLRWE
ncbi:type III polyketide synthase [Bacillus massilinigeriensis]|uniref:type III polyketide synthase n=1 Tax=Bacillus massilionigeriensis TaxID=1805475 RepID=UPI00096B3602|nr:3-oxoacyl-[acyl-carrier-protein] synthase III C-terminal domain-containing protein [Bacillus massilionigeriensis]